MRPHQGGLKPGQYAAPRRRANGCNGVKTVENCSIFGKCVKVGHAGGGVTVNRHEHGLVFTDQPNHRWNLGYGIGLNINILRSLAAEEKKGDDQNDGTSRLMGFHLACIGWFAVVFFCAHHVGRAQITAADSALAKPEGTEQPRLGLRTQRTPVEVRGYCRFLGYARNLSSHHGDTNTPLVLRADDEFNAPNLNVNVTFRPNANSFVALQLLTFDPFSGMGNDDRIFRLSRQGLVFSAGTSKPFGRFEMAYGGTQFVELGDFLMSSARQVQNSLFDRNAWTYVWPIGVQHGNYHSRSDYLREVDFGKRQFNGLRWTASELPGRMSIDIVAGRTPFNISSFPDQILAGRINKTHRLQKFGLGGMRSRGLDSWTNGEAYGMIALSASHEGKWKAWSLKSELAWGRHEIVSQGLRNGGFAFQTNLGVPRRLLGIPLNVEVFAISPHYVNLHSALINTSVDGFSSETSSFNGATVQDGARPFGAVLTPMHLIASNRATVRLTTKLVTGPFRVNLGYLTSMELQNLSSEITFYHKVTGLYMSRVDRFQQAAGPSGEITTFFRGAYQRVGMNDEGMRSNLKGYNAFRINAKWKGDKGDKSPFLFYLGEFLSVQEGLSAMPKMNDAALVRAQYHELDAYLPLGEVFAWVMYAGMERIVGNESTVSRATGSDGTPLHLDGLGTAVGTGFDVSMTGASSLFVRGKHVRYRDRAYEQSHLQGWEATVEFKIQF